MDDLIPGSGSKNKRRLSINELNVDELNRVRKESTSTFRAVINVTDQYGTNKSKRTDENDALMSKNSTIKRL